MTQWEHGYLTLKQKWVTTSCWGFTFAQFAILVADGVIQSKNRAEMDIPGQKRERGSPSFAFCSIWTLNKLKDIGEVVFPNSLY